MTRLEYRLGLVGLAAIAAAIAALWMMKGV